MTRLFCVISLGIMVLGCGPTQDDTPTPPQTNQEIDSGTTAAPSNIDGGVLPTSSTDGGEHIQPKRDAGSFPYNNEDAGPYNEAPSIDSGYQPSEPTDAGAPQTPHHDGGPSDEAPLVDSGYDTPSPSDAGTQTTVLSDSGPPTPYFECTSGFFNHDNDSSTACVSCDTPCEPGDTETQACSPTTNRVCETCPDGFHDADNDPSTACVACANTCDVGTTETQSCSPVTDRVCELCAEGSYDNDSDASTACVACTVCDTGETQIQACEPTSNRQCEVCPIGTTDNDSDPLTACVPCNDCARNEITHGICSPTSNIQCVSCGTNPAGEAPPTGITENVDFDACPDHDPYCENNIDIIVFYTPAHYEAVQGDLEGIKDVVNYTLYLANLSLENSFVKPDRRYRLMGIEPFPYLERGHQKSDLQWLQTNAYYQSRRKALGADVAIFFTGSASANAITYSNQYDYSSYADRGIIVLGGRAYYPETNTCGALAQLTPAHELGHILGGGHKSSELAGNVAATNRGYHNQEEHMRRNSAYGLPVSQHGLKVHTLMAYDSYDRPNGTLMGCLDCTQLPVFSSPDLWWFFDPTDPNYGYCIVMDDTDSQDITLLCQNPIAPWEPIPTGYQPNPAAMINLSAQALLERAIPLGVSQPVYSDDNGNVTSYAFTTDNRNKVIEFFPAKSNNSPVRAAADTCAQDCASTGHIHCAIDDIENCSDACLPGFHELADYCLPRVEINNTDALHDENYEPLELWAHPGQTESFHIYLKPHASVNHLEVYLATVNQDGAPDNSWYTNISGTIWTLVAPPAHTVEIFANYSDGTSSLIAKYPHDTETESSLAMVTVNDGDNQKNHALTYTKTFLNGLEDVEELEVHITSGDANEPGDYGFTLLESRTFGFPGCDDGHWDHDENPSTPCTPCTECATDPTDQFTGGRCTPSSDRFCYECDDDTPNTQFFNDVALTDLSDCPIGDPDCSNSLNLIFYYNEATLNDVFGGDFEALDAWTNNMVASLNQTAYNSLLPPDHIVRKVALKPVFMSPRYDSVSALAWARFNESFQEERRAVGADLGVFLVTETTSWMGYSYHLYEQIQWTERGLVMVNANFSGGQQCGRSGNSLTVAHEIGHLLGGKHNRANLGTAGSGTSYGYHNLEPDYRRNEAYGLQVSQYDQKFYTLMAYSQYRPGPGSDTLWCSDCERLPVFSSPDLWRFFREADPRYGYCRVLEENEDLTLQMVCAGDDTWIVEDGEYVHNPSAIITITPAELIARAVPLGVDATEDGGEATRNRDKVQGLWPFRASFADVIDHQCITDCVLENRVACAVGSQQCGTCLPGFQEFNGTCYGRVEHNSTDTRHDNKYLANGLIAAPNGDAETTVIELAPGNDIFRVEVYLTTTDTVGAENHDWLEYEGVITKLNEAPTHSLTVTLNHSDNTQTVLGNQATTGAIQQDFPNQNDHSLTYFFESESWLADVISVEVSYQSLNETYGFDLYEVRIFGGSL